MNKYTIELPEFAGPLDLLLHLIERNEFDITAISLVKVTKQYLAQIEILKEDRIDQLIDFLVVAARLVQIKSRALLPQSPVTIEGEEEEEDPAAALIRQLQQYRRFKEAADWLKDREIKGYRTYLRVAPPPKLESRLDLSGVNIHTLVLAVQAALHRVEDREDSVAIIQPPRLTIEGQIIRLRSLVTRGERVQFKEILSPNTSRTEIAVTLLALLELIKRREITAIQQEMFGSIEIIGSRSQPAA